MRDKSSIGTSHSTCSEAGTFDKVLAVRREVVRAVRVDARVERAKAEDAIPVAVGRAVGAPGSSAEEACVVPATTLRQLQSSDREETIMSAPKDRAMLVQSAASANKVRGRAVPRAGGCHVAAAHPILPASTTIPNAADPRIPSTVSLLSFSSHAKHEFPAVEVTTPGPTCKRVPPQCGLTLSAACRTSTVSIEWHKGCVHAETHG